MKATRKTIVFTTLVVIALVFSALSITTVSAQRAAPPAHTLVTARGNFAYSGTAKTSEPGSKGTGKQISAAAMQDLQARFAKQFSSGNNPSTIIGTFDLKEVKNTTAYPYRAIAYVYTEFPDGTYTDCSGFYIAPRLVATAAHCFWDAVHGAANGGWADDSYIYPGIQTGNFIPYGNDYANPSLGEGNYVTSWDWTINQSAYGDWGIIQTWDSLGTTVGWLGTTSVFQPRSAYTLTGYPDPGLAGFDWTQWGMNGKVAGVTTETNPDYAGIEGRLFYAMDTASEDGAPLFSKYYAVGINSDPIGLSPWPQYNSATLLDQEFFDAYSAFY
jgi:V8-like Glu-specific endopeptidase